MGPLSAVSQQTSVTTPVRSDDTNALAKESQSKREKLDLTQLSGTQAARTQSSETRNGRVANQNSDEDQQQNLVEARAQSTNSRRGSLLDLTV